MGRRAGIYRTRVRLLNGVTMRCRGLRFLSGGELAEPAVDLDGDGWRDVLVYDPDSPVLLAVSGKNGSLLWNHVGRQDGAGGPLTLIKRRSSARRSGVRPLANQR